MKKYVIGIVSVVTLALSSGAMACEKSNLPWPAQYTPMEETAMYGGRCGDDVSSRPTEAIKADALRRAAAREAAQQEAAQAKFASNIELYTPRGLPASNPPGDGNSNSSNSNSSNDNPRGVSCFF